MNEMGLTFLKWLQERRTPAIEEFFLDVTRGGEGFWILAVAGTLFWLFGARIGYRAGFALATGDLLTGALKSTFCVPRPWLRDPAIVPPPDAQWGAFGYSFPSGHTANTALLWGGLAAAARKAPTVTRCSPPRRNGSLPTSRIWPVCSSISQRTRAGFPKHSSMSPASNTAISARSLS